MSRRLTDGMLAAQLSLFSAWALSSARHSYAHRLTNMLDWSTRVMNIVRCTESALQLAALQPFRLSCHSLSPRIQREGRDDKEALGC